MGGTYTSVALRAGTVYLGFSILWIFTSDALVAGLPLSAQQVQAIQSLKGSLFVVLSALVLYLSLMVWERRACVELRARMEIADALRESEARFAQVAQHIEEVFWLTSVDKGEILYLSPGYEKIWGRPCADVMKNAALWLEAIHPEDRERVGQAIAVQAEGRYDCVYRIFTPDGQLRWIRDRAFPVRNPQGEVYRIAGVAQDVSAEQQALLGLQESQLRYQRVVDLSPDAIFVNCEQRIVMANPAMMRLVGASSEAQLLGRDPLELFAPEEREEVMAHIRLLQNEPDPQLPPRERRLLREDGSQVFIERHVVPFRHEGKPAILVVLHDLTATKLAQKELEQQRHRLEAVVQSSQEGILMLDPGGKVVLFNPAAEEMFALKVDEALGRDLGEFVQEALPAERLSATRATGVRGDSQVFPLELTQSPVPSEEGSLRVLSCRDLTHTMRLDEQRRSLEAQLRQAQKMEAVGQLAGGVAHDFNNLLTVMMGNLSLLKSDNDVEADPELLDEILQAVYRAGDLTRQLLTFSRKQVLQIGKLDLNDVIVNVSKMLSRLLGEDVEVHLQLMQELPPIEADSGMLEQILLNLAVNARDAMQEHGELWISTTVMDVDEGLAQKIIQGVPGRFVFSKGRTEASTRMEPF